jgi:GT2 family glycosyltransferase
MTFNDTKSTTPRVAVIIPSWNGADDLPKAVDSVLSQSVKNLNLIIVDNGSNDASKDIIESYKKSDNRVYAIYRDKNYGYTGGVNPGFKLAIEQGCTYAAPFNNDAAADKDWLHHLIEYLDTHDDYGIAACKLLHADGKTIDSTGDIFTIWGLPFPRGRDEATSAAFDTQTDIFGASGGASLYRISTLQQVGLFDDDFFAYSEDIDLSFRVQLAGWKVGYVPQSLVYHEQGATSSRMPSGFTTYQTLKNYPWVVWKNVPLRLLPTVLPRFALAYMLFIAAGLQRKQFSAVLKGTTASLFGLPKKLYQRRQIQKSRHVSVDYINSILTHDLPPNARRLRSLRLRWWRLRGKA